MIMPDLPPPPLERLAGTLQQLLALDALDLPTVLSKVAILINDLLAAEKVDLLLYDATIDSLVALGTSQTPLAQRERQLGLDRLPVSNKGRTVGVFQTGEPYITGRADTDPQVLPGFTEGLGVRSMLLAPFTVHGERRGVIGVSSTAPDRYTAADLALLTAVADWIGLVVHRTELAEALRQETARQAHARAADELMGVLSHDLDNYLMPIQLHLFTVHQRAVQDQRDADIRAISGALKALDRIQHLTLDLLTSTRMQQGVFHLTPTMWALAPLLEETAAALDTPQHPITVTVSGDLWLLADRQRLEQALDNLISNAIKHTGTGTAVQIAGAIDQRPDGDWALIRVRDQGPGIAPAHVVTLTQRFVAHGTNRGLGLGLYLADGIARAHGGAMTIESELGRGTTVTLALPGVVAPPQTRAAP